MRVHRRGAAALFAAFDLDCSLQPLPLCGGVTKASAFGVTAFLREKAVRKRARGAHPLNPAIGSLTIGRLHALRKGVRAISYCGFRFGLLLAAAAALRWGLKASAFGDTAFLREKAVRKRARGAHPLNPAIGSLTIGRLHALRKRVRAASCCGFRFDLLLAAAAALR